ncbi:substrate-binding domain-containing protein [Hoeflea sp. AS16]|uniref:substrate-binding domain-containing protein n=1 Tax=Hoeflea sp. AS16 TaxID=3135779 RepID=UPI003177EE3B
MRSSRTKVVSILSIAVLTLCFTPFSAAQAETLRIGGTGSATVLMERLGAAFAASEAGTTVEIIPGLGSSGSIAAAMDNVLDLAISARPLKPVETGLSEVAAVRTPYGLVSSNPNPGDISSADVAAFFSSPTSTWADGSPVRVILRPRNESDTALLGQTFPGMETAIDQVRERVDVPIAATDQDNLEMAKAIDGSLVGTSLAQVVTESHQIQFLTIDGVEPTLENLDNGQYPYTKLYRFIYAENSTPLVQRFLAFVNSGDGAILLREAGCLRTVQ